MILNPGFETPHPTQPNKPNLWTILTLGNAERTAVFRGDVLYTTTGHETFDHGWGDWNPQQLLTTFAGQALPAETMLSWVVNQGVMRLSATEAEVFDLATVTSEDFENGWGTIDRSFSFTSDELASGPTENFADWEAVQTTLLSWPAMFDDAPYETFLVRLPQSVTANVALHSLSSVAPFIGSAGDVVTLFAVAGCLPAPLQEGYTYVIGAVASESITLLRSADGPTVILEDVGAGTSFVQADPARFWLEEL